MKTEIKNYNGEKFEIEVYFNHSFKGRGSWNIECTVVYKGEERTFKHHMTNAPFIDEINDMKANGATFVEIQNRYFEAYFDDFKETVLEWIVLNGLKV